MRLLLALLLGGAIGYERERNNHPAGFRTHILVCMGSALLMLISMYGFSAFSAAPHVTMDPSRIASQVIPSIGFLGAGTILRNGFNVTGLTTAASLWVASAIGLAVGAGFYFGAVLTTGLMLISLYILNRVERRFFIDKRIYSLKVTAIDNPAALGAVSDLLEANNVLVRKLTVKDDVGSDGRSLQISLTIRVPKLKVMLVVAEKIRGLDGVASVSFDSI
ncbi:MgtC/SapB family protein [Gorillibacterium massiliense]|uniref:MgtC/SapB family protein n=1 Tax=Gorillibacterium massiliense TaxID=1280390 RepID=UPI0004B8EDE4|nr:MgtC/SapB family protein [Gorillibacterium massiliense]